MNNFDKVREQRIPSLHATIEEYVAPATGARHIHLATEQADLAFLVAFPTVPDRSDGRAHILEHIALCGSERYPVRDPFFCMMRRSIASFMNAYTYPDRTVYPFATTDRNDFFNLLDVYLDAAFFPRLDYLNFRQEGWRYTLVNGKLGYQGVVLNEMKGAFADPMQTLYSALGAHLLAGTTYAVDYGGNPLVIPDLTHEALKQFHASHYHPSQAIFMSAGRIGAAEIQAQISRHVLSRLSGKAKAMMPQLADVRAPRQAQVRVPSATARSDEFGLQISWILGLSSDPTVYYHASLLQAGLLGDASAPLRKVMESAGHGRPSALNGMDPSARQMLFHLGMEGLTQAQADDARRMIWQALELTAEQGVPVARLRAALRDIRYQQRDTASTGMPNILSRMLTALPSAMWGADVAYAFDSEPALARLEREIDTPGFFQQLVRKLLDTPARLDVVVVPDADYFSSRDLLEQERLATEEAELDDAARLRIMQESAALDALQRQPNGADILPRILPADVSPQPRELPTLIQADANQQTATIASNGLSYARVTFDVRSMTAQDWPWLQLYADLRPDLGVAEYDYEAAAVWCSAMVPTFRIMPEALQDLQGALRPSLVFYTSALQEEHDNMANLLHLYITRPRFDEHARIAFLIQRLVRGRMQNLAQQGRGLATLSATAALAPERAFEDALEGVASLPFLGYIEQLAGTAAGVAHIAERLAAIHAQIVASPAHILCAGSSEVGQLGAAIALPMARPAIAQPTPRAPTAELANSALHVPGQVNHCCIAWSVPALEHPQAAALAVAAALLTNQVLHTALRERGGAYGGSANYAANLGVFTMSSYRDPRLADTYTDFDGAIKTLLVDDFSTEQVEEAIICVIKELDRPLSPYDGALQAWQLAQRGVSEAMRQQFRRGVLHCKLDEIKAAAGIWLQKSQASRAAFVGNTEQDLAGLSLLDLHAFSATGNQP
eukprot:gene5575-5454_t